MGTEEYARREVIYAVRREGSGEVDEKGCRDCRFVEAGPLGIWVDLDTADDASRDVAGLKLRD
jgi:hypothetical protein